MRGTAGRVIRPIWRSAPGRAVLLATLAWVAPLRAQVRYDVSFPNAVHHEARISATFSGLPAGPVDLWMSRASPGRYALHEFAKNVYDVSATDGAGRTLALERPDPYRWRVSSPDGTVRVRYTLFADRADGTYSQVDLTHAHLNMPSAFLWADGLRDRPIEIRFHPPAGSGWKAATQLFPTDDPMRFTAPDLDYFMDSSTELSDYSLREWEVTSGGKTYPIRLAVHHQGTEAQVDRFAQLIRRVVDQEIAVYREAPAYDVGRYTFIADYLPWASGDGMEHRNSTILTSAGSLARNAMRLLGAVSHEFFHSWNVERIRPRSLQPFDYTRANMSRELWFAEGFTSYYTNLLLRRAGFLTDGLYARAISSGVDFVVNSPARRLFSAVEMSMQAPFVDAATSIDPTNRGNTFISYYTWGSMLGLGLDLTLRSRFDTSLDAYMRSMWREYGKPEIPYTLGDLESTLAELTGDAPFAHDFFARYIRGREVVDYGALLAHAGFLLRQARPGRPLLGASGVRYGPAGATLGGPTQIGTPLYAAGLDRGDLISSLGGRAIRTEADLDSVLDAHAPGDTVAIEYVQRGERRSGTVVLAQDPSLEIVPYEEAGLELTPAMRRFREAWLGPHHTPSETGAGRRGDTDSPGPGSP